jgi:methionine salvage enolase-phosphatase E1
LKWDYPRTIPAKFGLIWFSGFREEDLNVIFYQNMPNLHNLYKSAERKIPQKNADYMLNYSLPCSRSSNLSSLWFIPKQQRTIEEIYNFSNSSHLEWRAGLSDTNLKGVHSRTIPAMFGVIWFSGFRGEDLNVIFYQNMPNMPNRYKYLKEKLHRKIRNIC